MSNHACSSGLVVGLPSFLGDLEPGDADEGDRLSFTTVMTGLGVAVSALLGALYTAMAVMSGDLPSTFIRFVGSIALGAYYVYLFHLSRGRRFFAR
jgi:hypothetical protein